MRSHCDMNLVNKHDTAAVDFVQWMDEMVIDDPEEVVDVSDPEDDVPIASPVGVRAQPRCQSPRLSQLGQQTEGGRGRGRGAGRVGHSEAVRAHANLFGLN